MEEEGFSQSSGEEVTASIGDAVDVGTDALNAKFPDGIPASFDPELLSATVIDAAWPEMNNVFWEVHRHELERILLKNERLYKVYRTAKLFLDLHPEQSVSADRLRAALDEFEINYEVFENI